MPGAEPCISMRPQGHLGQQSRAWGFTPIRAVPTSRQGLPLMPMIWVLKATSLAVQGLQVTGIEPNGAMAPFAQQAFTAQPIPGGSLKLLKGVAEHLPLESASQDAVVTTIVSMQGESWPVC